jgi:hypothetical protein
VVGTRFLTVVVGTRFLTVVVGTRFLTVVGDRYCKATGAPDLLAENFFVKLQKEAFKQTDEVLDEVQACAQR